MDIWQWMQLESQLTPIQAQMQLDPSRAAAHLVRLYENVMGLPQSNKHTTNYVRFQCNLGHLFSQLPPGEQGTNVQRAIACYKEALRFWTPERTPLDYARIQNNLGIAYSELPIGDQTANVQRAIACYEEARLCPDSE
jgi:tetratricopeptide (TPR) repeat protein